MNSAVSFEFYLVTPLSLALHIEINDTLYFNIECPYMNHIPKRFNLVFSFYLTTVRTDKSKNKRKQNSFLISF